MQLYYQIIEQLDLAATQLHVDSPNYGRFSLILTDNAVELMEQVKTEKLITMDESRGWMLKPQFSAEERKHVRSGNFHAKNDFCLMAKCITRQEHSIIRVAHLIRNELYHSGVGHQTICGSLAWHYHSLACDLLPRLTGWGFWWGSNDMISSTVRQYTTESGLDFGDPQDCLRRAAKKLAAAKPQSVDPLPDVLSRAAIAELQDAADSLAFLASDNPNGMSMGGIVRELQFMHYLHGTDLSKVKSYSDWAAHRTKHAARWKPAHTRNPIPKWLRRARDIAQVTHDDRALTRFARLRGDSRHFCRLVHDAARDLDAQQQLELDAYRGK